LSFIFAMVCLFKPTQIAKIMTQWTIASASNSSLDIGLDLQKRITLLENDPKEFGKIFKSEISLIKQTGLTAMFVSIIGLFINIFAK
jgi:hypothetical protein